MTMRYRLVAASFLMSTVLISACGGNPPATSEPAASTPAPTATTGAAPTRQANQPSQPAAGGIFADIARAAQGASYQATYKMSFSGGAQAMSVEMKVYQKPGKRRTDTALAGLGSSSVFVLEDGTYSCSGQGAAGVCTKFPVGTSGPGQGPEVPDFTDRPAEVDAVPAGSRQVAGQQAQCFTLKPKTPGEDGEITSCMTSTGIMVYTQAKTANGEMVLEATSVSTSVSDADFQLPFPVGEFQMPNIPGMPGGQMPPNMPGLPGGQMPPNMPGLPGGQMPPNMPGAQ